MAPFFRKKGKKDPEDASTGDGSGDTVKLKSEMTLLNGCTVIIGCIIGSGIFISPTGVLMSTGSVNLSLIVWTFCGIFSMIGAYCYVELGCMIKKSGADYAYIYEAFGPLLAFVRLWMECIIIRPCNGAIQSLTFAIYILKPVYPDCDPTDEAVKLVAAACLLLLCFINCYSVRWANLVQDIFTCAKVFALLIIIITGFVNLGRGQTQNFTWENTETDPSIIMTACYSGLFAFSGWNYLNVIIEEMKNPVRDLPFAIAIGISVCTAIYLFTIVAFHSALNASELLGSEAVAVTFAKRMYGSWYGFIPFFVACSTFGAMNGTLLVASRLFFAGAREGQMPQVLTLIQIDRFTPIPAVVTITLLAMCYLTSWEVVILINYVGFATWLATGVAVFCIPYLRWKRPELERPVKVNLVFPIVYILLTLGIIILPIISKPIETLIGLAIILTSLPVYWFFIAWKNKPKFIRRYTYNFTVAIQKLIMAVPPTE